jgi:hypothetical protein
MRPTVPEKGQVTIPKPLRDRLGLRPGQVREFREEHGRLRCDSTAPARPRGQDVITAVDTSVLQDIFGADPVFGPPEGKVVACEVVWTETASVFPSPAVARQAFERLAVEFSPISRDTALEAATAWKAYRATGGRRERVAADFLAGAHAKLQAERLLTRDRGFYRSYFTGLAVVDPAEG